jgi:predicted RNA-binding protein YlqC (UPF0109 family)
MSNITTLELLRAIVEGLVDEPNEIQINEVSGDRTTVINIIVPKTEVGKIIGKDGRVIVAIRTIFENMAAKNGKRVNIHIID